MYDEILEELSYRIIGGAMTVHSTLGNGFQEVIYQRALAIELEKLKIDFERELRLDVFYDGINIGSRRVDFMIEKLMIVELKSVMKIENVHLAQGINYLIAYRVERGLILNFGARKLEVRRVYHPGSDED